MNIQAEINKVILDGTDFLKRQLAAGKCGLSCTNTSGQQTYSNEKGHLFSNFFITKAIGEDFTEAERSLILMRILSEEMNGTWGYSSGGYFKGPTNYPFTESDDTTFALRTLRYLNVYKPLTPLMHFHRRQWQFSTKGLRRYNGFTTFTVKKDNGKLFDIVTEKEVRDKHSKGFSRLGLKRRFKLVYQASSANNFEMHPEVNANIFNLLLGTDYDYLITADLIRQSQAEEGYWYSYFYPGKYYSTHVFLELLRHLPQFDSEITKSVQFLLKNQQLNGSWGNLYDSALALSALTWHSNPTSQESLRKGAEYLRSQQADNGAWQSDNVIWQFYEGDGDIWEARDVNHVVTTALCVAALKEYFNRVVNDGE